MCTGQPHTHSPHACHTHSAHRLDSQTQASVHRDRRTAEPLANTHEHIHTRIHTPPHTRLTRALTYPHGCHTRRQACLTPSHAHPLGDPCRVVPGRGSSRTLSLIVPPKVTVARPHQAPQRQFLSSDTLRPPLQVLLIMAMVVTLARGPALRKSEVHFIPGPALHTRLPLPSRLVCKHIPPSSFFSVLFSPPGTASPLSILEIKLLTSRQAPRPSSGSSPTPASRKKAAPPLLLFPYHHPLLPQPPFPLSPSSLVPHTWALTQGSEQALP